ncbi:hypothetical protein BHE74_00008457 [Ensete ventricosum]|nr:hypothetical protein GW17_00005121 [Ensete ventricosum]RWW83049.1 hypothetical protein BHE74_00008457 [Ensete ventricosum]RZR93483.1 hypothetical protein BHM03_00021998 [Ensete ventricosum]
MRGEGIARWRRITCATDHVGEPGKSSVLPLLLLLSPSIDHRRLKSTANDRFQGYRLVADGLHTGQLVDRYIPPDMGPYRSLRQSLFFDGYLDPEYMEFLELISKPVEHLPSAEIQLERKEAERAGQL